LEIRICQADILGAHAPLLHHSHLIRCARGVRASPRLPKALRATDFSVLAYRVVMVHFAPAFCLFFSSRNLIARPY
jgi:hypothetical protein